MVTAIAVLNAFAEGSIGLKGPAMKTIMILAVASTITATAALAQELVPAPVGPVPAVSTPAAGHATQTTSVSNEETRSAAELALSHDPVFDEGSAARIKQAIQRYSDIAARGGWPSIPSDAKFAIGTAGPNDDILRKRLIVTGDLASDKSTGPFDETVVEAVKHFQQRHGLPTTGAVMSRTMAAMNVPVQKRLKQLEASLDRLEHINFPFGQRYVVVNIPAAFAEAVEGDKVVRRYRVVVGKPDKPSPTVTSEITGVVLNPTWTVPSSITKTEISAHMRKDPDYITRMHMEVLDAHDNPVDPHSVDWSGNQAPGFTVRQQSGTWNALGAVKIDMPNAYSVYMHDSNQHNLFAEDYRFLSHGCARVDNVRDLAAWLLDSTPKWNRATIDSTIATGVHEEVALPRKVPVAWVYLTAWATRDNTLQFRNDIYNQDEQLLEATSETAGFFDQSANHH